MAWLKRIGEDMPELCHQGHGNIVADRFLLFTGTLMVYLPPCTGVASKKWYSLFV